MTCRLLCVLLAASLLGAAPIGAAPRKPAKGGLDANLTRASAFCEAAASREAGSGFRPPAEGRTAVHDGTPPALGTPDLVKRFAQTQPSGRFASLASSTPFYLHFIAPGGDVWAVVYDILPTCDVMVTGADADMPAAASRLIESLRKGGWQIDLSKPATATMPLAQHVLVKRLPKPGAPDSGLRLRIRALSGDAAAKDGSQLDMSFMSTKITASSPDPQ